MEKIKPHHHYLMGLFLSCLFKALLPLPIKGIKKKDRGKNPNLIKSFSLSARAARELYVLPVKEKLQCQTPWDPHSLWDWQQHKAKHRRVFFFRTGSAMQLLFSYGGVGGWLLLPSRNVCQDWRFALWTEQSLVWFPATI